MACMSREQFYERLTGTLDEIRGAGLWKPERIIVSPQGGEVEVSGDGGHETVLNLCANNYLGLADHPAVVAAAGTRHEDQRQQCHDEPAGVEW